MTRHLGNIPTGQMLAFLFETVNTNGSAVAPDTAGTVSIYRDDGTTESTAGITYTPSFDGVEGVNLVRIETSDAFYASGHDFTVVLSGAVIPGVFGHAPTSLNAVLADFSIEHRLADLQTIKKRPIVDPGVSNSVYFSTVAPATAAALSSVASDVSLIKATRVLHSGMIYFTTGSSGWTEDFDVSELQGYAMLIAGKWIVECIGAFEESGVLMWKPSIEPTLDSEPINILPLRAAVQTIEQEAVAEIQNGLATTSDLQSITNALGTLTEDERAALADVFLSRNVSHSEADAALTSLATLILAATNKANTTAHLGKLTVYRTDGISEHAQIPITPAPAGTPLSGIGG